MAGGSGEQRFSQLRPTETAQALCLVSGDQGVQRQRRRLRMRIAQCEHVGRLATSQKHQPRGTQRHLDGHAVLAKAAATRVQLHAQLAQRPARQAQLIVEHLAPALGEAVLLRVAGALEQAAEAAR